MGRFRLALVMAAVLLLHCIAFAVPQLINYQGKLNNSSGNPVDGDYNITFTIYNAAVGGDVLWTETQTVTVSDGVFNVLLGSQNPILANAFDGNESYLGVKVGEDPEMTPRQQLASVPYAISAENAISADSALIAETCTTPACVPGDSLTCYTGDPATRGIGECATGIRTCGPDGAFGACVGEVTPVTEICLDGFDSDCDGETDDGCPIHYIFATSGSYMGNLGGLSGADAICQSLGNSGSFTSGLGATWTAVLSDNSTDANFRVSLGGPLYNTHGDLVANDSNDLWDGTVANPAGWDQNGDPVGLNFAWTGSSSDGGTVYEACSNWSNSTTGMTGIKGSVSASSSTWIYESSASCSEFNHLYCVSSTITQ